MAETKKVMVEENPDMEQRRRIMDFVMAAGQTLLENGAEVFRVQQTMDIMARSLHLREFNVYVITNGIFASAGTAEISEIRHVPRTSYHLGRVAAVNALSREIAGGGVSVEQAECRLAAIRQLPNNTPMRNVLYSAAGAAGITLMFGGMPADAVTAAGASVLLALFQEACAHTETSDLFRRGVGAAILCAACLLAARMWPAVNADMAIIGSLLLLTPGVAFTMAIRDFMHGDYLSGTIRLIDALLVAAALACGAGLVLVGWQWLWGIPV